MTLTAPGGPSAFLIPHESARYPGGSWGVALRSQGSSAREHAVSIVGSNRPVLRWESVSERMRQATGLDDDTDRWILHIEMDFEADLLTRGTKFVLPGDPGRMQVVYLVFDARID